MKLTFRLENAIKIAAQAHAKQNRKGGEIPYIIHPFAVMFIASEFTDDEDTLVACLLHDVLEDVPEEYSKEQMRKDFGDNVVSIVEGVTKDESMPEWQDRADAYLKHLENEASDASVLVSAADKMHNLISILSDYKIHGEQLFERFNADKKQQKWWYESVLAIVKKRLPESMIIDPLGELVTELQKL